MSYNVEELFRFEKCRDEYAIAEYLKKDDPSITELEIPAEYNGRPVVKIGKEAVYNAEYIRRVKIPGSVRGILTTAFCECSSLEEVEFSEGLELISNYAFASTALKIVRFPKSLNAIYWGAFAFCRELERVEFNSAPIIELNVFSGCLKLPPETVVMGIVRSFDITAPIYNNNDLLRLTSERSGESFDCFRPDVFELLVKNNCFKNCDLNHLFKRMIDENKPERFPIAEQYGIAADPRFFDMLLNYAIEHKITEVTAYLLDLKNRKFGFDGGEDFEL